MKTKMQLKQYRVQQTGLDPKTGKPRAPEVIVEAYDAFAALGKYRGRGVNGLGKGWTLTRQPDGWIVCANSDQKVLERALHRMKEVGWVRGMNAI
jgi:hypothetical protein